MGTERTPDDVVGRTARRSAEQCPNDFKPWILALAVMVVITLAWSVFEAQKRGKGLGTFFGGKAEGESTAMATPVGAGPATELQRSYHNLIEGIRPAVISIDALVQDQANNPGDPQATFARIGSGVIIDPRGFVLSSLHVVDGASSLKATVYATAGAVEYPIKVVKGDRTTDLVLLLIQADEPLPYASLGDSNSVRTGDIVLSIGSPFGFEQSVTSGIVSSRNRTLSVGGVVYENLIQTDSSINKGSSGGPLVSAQGGVIGINTAIYSPTGSYAGISFAVPINRSLDLVGGLVDFQNSPSPVAKGQLAAWRGSARQIGNAFHLGNRQVITPPHNYRGVCIECHPQLRSPNYVLPPDGAFPNNVPPAAANPAAAQVAGMRGNPVAASPVVGPRKVTLGLTVMAVDDVIAQQNGMVRPEGVLVNTVMPGSPAEAAGLQRGDVVTRLDGRSIRDVEHFSQLLTAKTGTTIDLVMLRFGARKTATVDLQLVGGVAAAAVKPVKAPMDFEWIGADIGQLPAGRTGVVVTEVEGVLAVAGVKAGDVIKGMNGIPTLDMAAFIEMTTKVDLKKGFVLDVSRMGDPMFITVKG